jgi:hypothetical protein
MVGAVATFLRAIAVSLPALYGALDNVVPLEEAAVRRVYAALPSADFSRDVLTVRPELLGVMPVEGVTWSDLGSPERVRRARSHPEDALALAGAAA